MAAITHVYIASYVAATLGISEDELDDIALYMEPEDGVLRIWDKPGEGIYGFTDFGIENVRQILDDRKS
jgi:hypothetical protein